MVITRSATRALSLSDNEEPTSHTELQSPKYEKKSISSASDSDEFHAIEDEEYESVTSTGWKHTLKKRRGPPAPKPNPCGHRQGQRGGQRKTHVYRIPVPPPAELEQIRKSFERPHERQVWGVIRDNFSAVEHLWADHYGWDLPRTKVELDYGELVRNIGRYRKLPAVDGRTCDRCSARGQTGSCRHNHRDACRGCLRNNVECTFTTRSTLITVPLRGMGNLPVDVVDKDAIEIHFDRLQQPPVQYRWGTSNRRKAASRRKYVRTPRTDTDHEYDSHFESVPDQQVAPHPHFMPQQQPFPDHAPFAPQYPMPQQFPLPQAPLFYEQHVTGQQQGQQPMPMGLGESQDPPYPKDFDSLAMNFLTLKQQVNQLAHERDTMWAEITYLRNEVQRLGGAKEQTDLVPMLRAPAPFEGPASFPVPAALQSQSRSQNQTPGSFSNSPATPLDGPTPFSAPSPFGSITTETFHYVPPSPGIVPPPARSIPRSATPGIRTQSRAQGTKKQDKPYSLMRENRDGIGKRRMIKDGGKRKPSSARVRRLAEHIGEFDGSNPQLENQGASGYVEAGWTPQGEAETTGSAIYNAESPKEEEDRRRSSGERMASEITGALHEWTYCDPTLQQLAYPNSSIAIPGIEEYYDPNLS